MRRPQAMLITAGAAERRWSRSDQLHLPQQGRRATNGAQSRSGQVKSGGATRAQGRGVSQNPGSSSNKHHATLEQLCAVSPADPWPSSASASIPNQLIPLADVREQLTLFFLRSYRLTAKLR